MFDRLSTLPHRLRVFVEALLYGFQHILVLPACDAPLHAGGAALLERTVATRICPIASQLLPVLLVRIVVLQLFASWTAIRILVAEIDKVLLAEATPCLDSWCHRFGKRNRDSGSIAGEDFLAAVVTAIGNGFEFIDAEDVLRLRGNVCELRSI